MFQQPDFLGMAGEAGAGIGRARRLAADHQDGAEAFLERADALRDRRGGEVKFGRGGLEGAAAQHRGEGADLGMVEHEPG